MCVPALKIADSPGSKEITQLFTTLCSKSTIRAQRQKKEQISLTDEKVFKKVIVLKHKNNGFTVPPPVGRVYRGGRRF